MAQAQVLSKSVQAHMHGWKFIIGLVDRKKENIGYNTFGCEILEAPIIEPDVDCLAKKYSLVELNTCLKPSYFQYFFDQYQADQVIYLDPDICLYNPMDEIEHCFIHDDFILTPHIITPIPLDGNSPDEPLFLNYGLYNLGFLALKKTSQTSRFLSWWKDRTYLNGYDKPAAGLFTDQLWINLVPLYFEKVNILRHQGYNMAPWNLHERHLEKAGDHYYVNSNLPLIFFHFSGFDPGKEKFHKEYSRFKWAQRADLVSLYKDYKGELEKGNYDSYKSISCYYTSIRNEYLQAGESIRKQTDAALYANLPFYKKIIRRLKNFMPVTIKKLAIKLIRT